jgi:hypothetical protein
VPPDDELAPDGALLLEDELPDGELLDAELLDEELLEDELLLDELDELDDALLGDGIDGLGGWGVCGVVGVLALGQPLSSAHTPSRAATLRHVCRDATPILPPRASALLPLPRLPPSGPALSPIAAVISYYPGRRIHGEAIADLRPERRLAQSSHEVVRELVEGRVVVTPGQVVDPPTRIHREF